MAFVRAASAAKEAEETSCNPVALLPLDISVTFSPKRRLLRRLHMLSYRLGLSSVYGRVASQLTGQSVASILMYHSIPSPHEVPWLDPRNCLSAACFDRHMKFLATRRHVVSVDELVAQLATGKPIWRGTVAITFDDGYLNNLRVAAPILAKYDLPATLYLATAYVSAAKNQWIDTLYGAFRARSQNLLHLNGEHWDLSVGAEAAYASVASHLIRCTPEQRAQVLQSVDEQLAPRAYPPRLTMNWDEVRELQRDYPQVSLGVHTANHLDLDTHSDRADEEMQLSITQVLTETGKRPQHLAFPYNRYNDSAQKQVAQHLRSAVAIAPDPVVRTHTSPYALPRLAAPQSLTLLKSWTNGGFPDIGQRLFGQVWTRPF
ncbi:MAG: polysaccharide deacetylase family protein [Cyanobacteria bacterium J06560_2]